MTDPRAFALLALIVLGFAGWHLRPSLAALLDAWRLSKHPTQLGPMRRADITRRTP